jgi:mono/diheme cytochrome c family protein
MTSRARFVRSAFFIKIAISRIKSRENSPSGMPPMGSLLSKREIRDVVEYLSSLKSK